MKGILVGLGVITIAVVFWDVFETFILPRRVSRRFRLARGFFRLTWKAWSGMARAVHRAGRRESYLSFYGPLSVLILMAFWATGTIVGFALLQAGGGRFLPPGSSSFPTLLYLSASTFFTLGLGDIVPASSFARAVTVTESGAGLAFLALVISYLPVLYQAFSRREVRISMLDERAGSPPSAFELVERRGAAYKDTGAQFLRDWELWSAEILESHLSYPVLCYFRSQHDNQSWVAALTVILDACALVLMGIDGIPDGQARLTFAMARHAAVDLASTLGTPPLAPDPDRLPIEELHRMRIELADRGLMLAGGEEADEALGDLRASYEPYINAISRHLRMPLPAWVPAEGATDNWEVTRWESSSGRRARREVYPEGLGPDRPAGVAPSGEDQPPAVSSPNR